MTNDQRQVEAELRQARDQALATSRANSELLATVSHEIRTPLNGIVGLIELLKETSLDERQAGYLATIEKTTTALLAILGDALDVSKIEAGKLSLDVQPFDLRALVEDVAQLLTPLAERRALRMICRAAPDVPAQLAGDPVRIRQVLTNLISNAVKFTKQGGVMVEAAVVAAAPDGCRVRLSVQDTGMGIPRERQEAVFERFAQIPGESQRMQEGTGLGLTICRSLVELMGGWIRLESEPGVGSTFSVELPLGMAHASASASEPWPPAVEAPLVNQLRVLLVEDHEVNRQVAVELIERLGCQVVAVADGHAALAALEDGAYDVVLMDIELPGMSGLEAAAELRRREARTGRRMPVIALTAHALTGDRERCLDAGMDDYLVKPLRPGTLRAALVRRSPVRTKESRAELAAAAPRRAAIQTFDRALLADCCGGSSALIVQVLESFLSSAPPSLRAIAAAVDAGALPELEREAHRFKGACQTIGAGPLVAGCARLQSLARSHDIASAVDARDTLLDEWEHLRAEVMDYLSALRDR